SSSRGPARWLAMSSASKKYALIAVRTRPLSGIGASSTWSYAAMRSLATMSSVSPSIWYSSRTFPAARWREEEGSGRMGASVDGPAGGPGHPRGSGQPGVQPLPERRVGLIGAEVVEHLVAPTLELAVGDLRARVVLRAGLRREPAEAPRGGDGVGGPAQEQRGGAQGSAAGQEAPAAGEHRARGPRGDPAVVDERVGLVVRHVLRYPGHVVRLELLDREPRQ